MHLQPVVEQQSQGKRKTEEPLRKVHWRYSCCWKKIAPEEICGGRRRKVTLPVDAFPHTSDKILPCWLVVSSKKDQENEEQFWKRNGEDRQTWFRQKAHREVTVFCLLPEWAQPEAEMWTVGRKCVPYSICDLPATVGNQPGFRHCTGQNTEF